MHSQKNIKFIPEDCDLCQVISYLFCLDFYKFLPMRFVFLYSVFNDAVSSAD
jgi:hypothetical protein